MISSIKWLISIVALIYTCNIPVDIYNEPTVTEKDMTTCNRALEQIKNRDFIAWKGLPSACDWSLFAGELPKEWELVAERFLGSNFVRGKVLKVEAEGYLQASMAFLDEKAILFEAKGPELATSLETLLHDLGAPADKLDWQFGFLSCPKSEYIYPERGITLFMNTDLTKVYHIALYASTSLENYLENIRPKFGKKRLPKRR